MIRTALWGTGDIAAAHAAQIRNFLEVIGGTAEPTAKPEDGRQIIELLTAAYESAATGKEISLPLSADDPYYTLEGN